MKSWSVKDVDEEVVNYIKEYANTYGYKTAGALKAIVQGHRTLDRGGDSYSIVPNFDWYNLPIGRITFRQDDWRTAPAVLKSMVLSPAWTTDNDGNTEILGFGLVPRPMLEEYSNESVAEDEVPVATTE